MAPDVPVGTVDGAPVLEEPSQRRPVVIIGPAALNMMDTIGG
jgi:hypothetical protein